MGSMEPIARDGNPVALPRLTHMALRLERDTPLCIIAFSVSYWLFTALHSMARLWYDELKTFYISRLPSADMIWTALAAGVFAGISRCIGNPRLRLPSGDPLRHGRTGPGMADAEG